MKIRVLVVDDSAFMRKVISDILTSSPDIEVVGVARNGKEAIEKTTALKPDVITLDVEMPVMDGLAALESIMKDMPRPVLMLSSYTVEGAEATIKSLELGAVDFIPKPTNLFKVNTDAMKTEIIEKVRMASKVRIRASRLLAPVRRTSERPSAEGRSAVRPGARTSSCPQPSKDYTSSGRLRKIVAIGTSTGGPKALQPVIPQLPGNIDAGILLVQHMPMGFTKSLAERLNGMSELNVKEAEHGDVVRAGWVYLAPGGNQMRVDKVGTEFRIRIENTETVSGHKPSVDALMHSIAQTRFQNVIGVIMTGMGSDGAKGLEEVKSSNKAFIIAQDEESCVVFGMPKSTIERGVVDKVVSVEEIAYEIMKAMEV